MTEPTMENCLAQVLQKDMGRRLQVGQEIIDYILDKEKSHDLEQDQTALDKMVDGIASSWVNSSNFKVNSTEEAVNYRNHSGVEPQGPDISNVGLLVSVCGASFCGFQSTELVESAAEPIGERHPSDWLFSQANQCPTRETEKEPVAVVSMIFFPPLPTAPFDIISIRSGYISKSVAAFCLPVSIFE